MSENLNIQEKVESKERLTNNSHETLFSWLLSLGKAGFKSLPQMAMTLAIQIGIVLLFQLVFWWNGIARFIPGFIKGPVIFLTATYNNLIPKTLYWIIVFTFGKKLFLKIKNLGFKKAMSPIYSTIPDIKRAYIYLKSQANSLLLIGGGVGLIVANNFASYSRFSGARNKFDKYFIVLVISFTISYLLGEGRKHWIFKFCRLFCSDVSHLFKLKNNYTDNYTYLISSGFVLGLLADAPLILMKLKYGGYILGLACLIFGIVLNVLYHRKGKKV
jgi:hypothetical protein